MVTGRILFIGSLLALALGACKTPKKNASVKIGMDNVPEAFTKEKLEENHYFMSASREKLLGNYNEAVRLYKKTLQVNPHNAAAAYELSIICLNSNEFAAAEQFGKTAYRENPDNHWYALLLAEALQRNGKNSEASKIYEKLRKQLPDRMDICLDYADCLLRMKKPADAIDVLNQFEKTQGIQPEISLQKQKIYIKSGKLDKAVEELEKLIAGNPDEIRYALILAELYAANNLHDKSLQTYENALKREPENPLVNLSISEFYRQKKDYDKAVPCLRKAFASEEVDIDSKIKILLSYYLLSENDSTLKIHVKNLCTELRDAHPRDPKAFSISGDFALRDKEISAARDFYQKTTELDKSKYIVWSQLLLVESDLGDFVSMEKHAAEAAELFPNEPSVFLLYGIALLQNKKPNEAIPVLNNGLALVVDNKALHGQLYANLGDAYYRTHEMAKSDESYEKALELNPKDTYVLNNYAYYLSLRNDKLEKAEAMSKKAIEIEPGNSSYLDTYGWILYMMGRFEESRKYLEKSIEAGASSSAVVLEHYGDVQYKLNNAEKALEFWQKAKNSGTGSDLLEKKILEKKLIE